MQAQQNVIIVSIVVLAEQMWWCQRLVFLLVTETPKLGVEFTFPQPQQVEEEQQQHQEEEKHSHNISHEGLSKGGETFVCRRYKADMISISFWKYRGKHNHNITYK